MGTPIVHERIYRSRFRSPTRWNLALSGRPSLVCARAKTGTGWLPTSALRGSSLPLPPLSAPRALSRISNGHHQSATSQCGFLAARFLCATLFIVPAGSSISRSSFWAFRGSSCIRRGQTRLRRNGFFSRASSCTLGRLGALPDPAEMGESATHTNGHIDDELGST